MMTKREPNIFDKINNWIDGVEGSFISLLTAIAPWLAPLPPAYMTYTHAISALSFPVWVALAIAGVVEVLGLATVSTGINFWKYNQRNQRASEYRKAPVEIVVGTFVFYLAVIITSNVLLDAAGYFFPENIRYVLVAVRALYTLLTIPAALIISVRQQHRDILDEMSAPRQVSVNSSSSNKSGTTRTTKVKGSVFSFLDDILKREGRVASYTEVRDALHIPPASASRLRNEWIQNNNVNVTP
jgi:hypothetical protein